MKIIRYLFLFASFAVTSAYSQVNSQINLDLVDSVKFFQDEAIIDVTLETDLKDLLGKRQKDRYLPSTITMAFPDGISITEKIQVSVRGKFRRENCYMPGLSLNFHNSTSPRLYKLDRLKLVCGCSSGSENEQLVLREFLAYKIYNLLTEKSFRARLVKVTFKDAAGKKKPYTQHAFFLEDVDEMARRNGMIEVEGTPYNTELTDRTIMTQVAIFEYLLGNTDWSVPNYHNIKLIGPKEATTTRPYPVPYDFDICGFVDPPYATIDERFDITTVRERLYRGFPRSMEELQVTINLFNEKKQAIYDLVSGFELLDRKSKDWLKKFLDEFYRTINNPRDVKSAFIDGARTQ